MVRRLRVAGFDLDGTLVDTAPDLAAASNAMLATLGLSELAEERIAGFVGDGIDMLVVRALRDSTGKTPPPSLIRAALELFRRRYGERSFDRSRIYPGVVEGLESLRACGFARCCLTNKPGAFTIPLVRAAGLAGLLDFVLCADAAEQRKPAPALLLAACARLGIGTGQMLYVGDSHVDLAAARAAGCPVALVDYGYGAKGWSATDRPDWIIGSLNEVIVLMTGTRPADAIRRMEGSSTC